MTLVYDNIGHIVTLLCLLVGSTVFSGAETAFFNLSRRQLEVFGKSCSRLQRMTAKMMAEPKNLLGCLLLGNMIVNVLYFATASILALRLERQVSLTAAAVSAFLTFMILVVFGEIVPKSVAFSNSTLLSSVFAVPAYFFLRIFTPLVVTFRFLIVDPALRLLLGNGKEPAEVSNAEFKILVELLRKRGLITTDENKLLSEIVELDLLKVRDCLQSRVDMVACSVAESSRAIQQIMNKHNLIKIPVYVDHVDNIVGLVHMRQLLLRPEMSLDKLVQPVNFIPEQKSIESLLEFFRKSGTDTAMVVDEYGGISGIIRVEDIAEELLGPIETGDDETPPIEQTGPFEYRLRGNMAVHEWAESFGIDASQWQVATIGGLIAASLGKLPRPGDVTYVRNLKFTVENVKKRRIESVIVSLELAKKND